jgi:hypothetical protein
MTAWRPARVKGELTATALKALLSLSVACAPRSAYWTENRAHEALRDGDLVTGAALLRRSLELGMSPSWALLNLVYALLASGSERLPKPFTSGGRERGGESFQ